MHPFSPGSALYLSWSNAHSSYIFCPGVRAISITKVSLIPHSVMTRTRNLKMISRRGKKASAIAFIYPNPNITMKAIFLSFENLTLFTKTFVAFWILFHKAEESLGNTCGFQPSTCERNQAVRSQWRIGNNTIIADQKALFIESMALGFFLFSFFSFLPYFLLSPHPFFLSFTLFLPLQPDRGPLEARDCILFISAFPHMSDME